MLFTFVDGLQAANSPDALGRYLFQAVRTLVPADVSTYSELDPRRGRETAVEFVDPPGLLTPEAAASFERHMGDHPLVAYYARTGDGRARKVSDFQTRSQLRRSPLYNDYVRPYFRVEHQIAVAVTATPSRIVGMSLSRSGRDFTERDRTMLDLIRPHVVQAHRTAATVARLGAELTMLRETIDDLPSGIVVLDGCGKRVFASAAALRLMADYFEPTPAASLPDALTRWLRDQLSPRRIDDPPSVSRPLVTEGPGRCLVVRLTRQREGCLLLLEEQWPHNDAAALTVLGLTHREAEVLCWVAAGKTSRDIGLLLGVSGRTVEKHLERIFRKLGVENRTAALGLVRSRISGR